MKKKKIALITGITGQDGSYLAELLLNTLELTNTKLNYTGGSPGWHGGGWPGDINVVNYDISKILSLGWKPNFTAKEAVKLAITDLYFHSLGILPIFL